MEKNNGNEGTNVILGGTFAYLHGGHMAILDKAFSIGDYVYIGITSDSYVRSRKAASYESYAKRVKRLQRFARSTGKRFRIGPINDSYGPSAIGDFDAIVVSRDTYPSAMEINRARREIGNTQMKIVTIPYELAYDGRPISSTRIFNGEIDAKGRRAKA